MGSRVLLVLVVIAAGAASLSCTQSDPPRSAARASTEKRWISWTPRMSAGRRRLVITHLQKRTEGKPAEIRKLQEEHLSESPLSFFRATAHLFHRDMRADDFIAQSFFYRRDNVTWVLGDAHVGNAGPFEDDRGKVVFDLNDFDQAWIANPLHDVWRMATSISLLSRENGLERPLERMAITAFAVAYADEILGDAPPSGIADVLGADGRLSAGDARVRMLDKYAPLEDGRRRFARTGRKLRAIEGEERTTLVSAIESLYPSSLEGRLKNRADYFKVSDVARRIDAGVGSLGADRYWVLVRGPTSELSDDRILEVKAQPPPALAELMSRTKPPTVLASSTPGCRVAIAHQSMLEAASEHVGCFEALGQSFSVRERSPYKDALDLGSIDSGARLQALARQLGVVLARAHVRGGARVVDDEHPAFAPMFKRILRESTLGAITSRKVLFVEETIAVGVRYADQVELDFAMYRSQNERAE